MLPKDENFQL